MPTLVFDPMPGALEQLLAERARLGLDRRDEVWEGVLYMIPPPNVRHGQLASRLHRLLGPLADRVGLELAGAIGIGDGEDDYRVPDLALLRPGFAPQWNTTAALVVEILSPGDKSGEKLGFFAAHRVGEVVMVDPATHTLEWLALDGAYRPTERSSVIDTDVDGLANRIDWPA
jgi:Uma2 family endonuclease